MLAVNERVISVLSVRAYVAAVYYAQPVEVFARGSKRFDMTNFPREIFTTERREVSRYEMFKVLTLLRSADDKEVREQIHIHSARAVNAHEAFSFAHSRPELLVGVLQTLLEFEGRKLCIGPSGHGGQVRADLMESPQRWPAQADFLVRIRR